MRHDAPWQARILLVLSGALRVWGVPGRVTRDPDATDGFVIAPLGTDGAIRVRHLDPAGWTVTLRDPAAGAETPPGCHAGLPGLLRELRRQLAPDAPAGRLVIGAQALFPRAPDAQ